MPRKAITNCRIVEFGGAVLAVGPKGALYGSGRLPTQSYSYVGWTWDWLPRLATCLFELGLITKHDKEATVRAHDQECARIDRERLEGLLKSLVKEVGIKGVRKMLAAVGEGAVAIETGGRGNG